MWRRVALVIAAATVALASAQCSLDSDATLSQLDVEGLSAYFPQFRTDRASGRIEFFGGVCVTGAGWTLLAEEVVIDGLAEVLELRAVEPVLFVPGYVVRGSSLLASEQTLTLLEAAFEGEEFSGRADRVDYLIERAEFQLQRPYLMGDGFRIEGSSARLAGSELVVEDALGTTCLCAGSPLYAVRGSRAEIDVFESLVHLTDGEVRLAGLTIELEPEVDFDIDDLAKVEVPVSFSYDADDPVAGTVGRGLGVVIEGLEVAAGSRVDAGLFGLDRGHALVPQLLLSADEDGAAVRFGVEQGAVISDIEVVRQLTQRLRALVAFRNLGIEAEGFLHEGLLQLEANTRLAVPPGLQRVTVNAAAFVAASGQALPLDPVADARLGLAAGFTAVLPPTDLGRGSVRASSRLTYYPKAGVWQHGVSLFPRWQVDLAGGSWTTDYRRVWTNGASPFTVEVDRLEPENLLRTRFRITRRFESADLTVGADADYSFLLGEGLQTLHAEAAVAVPQPFGSLDASAEVELAALVAAGPNLEAFAEGRVGLTWIRANGLAELGVRARYDFAPEAGLEALEVTVGYPFGDEIVVLSPLLAVELSPLLAGGSVQIAGHGLEVVWHSCCGTFTVGYRQVPSGFEANVGVTIGSQPVR